MGAISSIKARAPVTGGNFGVWGGMFSTFDCAIKGWRQKEDAWNAIISGFMTGGCLALRSAFQCFCPSSLLLLKFTLANPFYRWSTFSPWFGYCVWHPAWCFRGCWSFNVSSI